MSTPNLGSKKRRILTPGGFFNQITRAKQSSWVETVPELKQGRSHGESEGANSACGFLFDARFVPCGLPLFQLRDFASKIGNN